MDKGGRKPSRVFHSAPRGSPRAKLAAGIIVDLVAPGSINDEDRVTKLLASELNASAVWQSGHIPPELRGENAHGDSLPRWRPVTLALGQRDTLECAWRDALPQRGKGMANYLRLRVNTPEDVRYLRGIGDIDGMIIVPSIDSRGSLRTLRWRWPLRVGVASGSSTNNWLVDVRKSMHLGLVFDAELYSPSNAYDIVILDASLLATFSQEQTKKLSKVACVIVAGDSEVEQMLQELDKRVKPSIAVAFNGPPSTWWSHFYKELSHDLPVDVAVELVVRSQGLDGLMVGPDQGLDITASAHWFASIAPELPELEQGLRDYLPWEWASESGGTTRGVHEVRQAWTTGADPRAIVPGGKRRRTTSGRHYLMKPEAGALRPSGPKQPPEVRPAQPRRLVARMHDGKSVVESILPPKRELLFAVSIGIPGRGDVFADEVFPEAFEETGPTVLLEVLVRSDVWPVQPPKQMISLSTNNKTEPSSIAVFELTTPDAGHIVSIEIVVLYQGKPLQAATYVSPVRAFGLSDEKPTLRTFSLSGPNEPTDDLRQVDVALEGRGAVLQRLDGQDGMVLITDVQDKLDVIEERISRVLGVTGAPDSFESPEALTLLIELARMGFELARQLAPLNLGDAKSINVSVNGDTRVVPLELAYSAPPPDLKGTRLCSHVTDSHPPKLGEMCSRAGPRIVCPYAFWGLHRSISRTVWSAPPRRSSSTMSTVPAPGFSILYAATVVADAGAVAPTPSDTVFAAAQGASSLVTRVRSWSAWRDAIRVDRPNLLVVLGHTEVGSEMRLYIGKKSVVSRVNISRNLLRSASSPKPLVLLIACSTAALGDPFGTLPGAFIAEGAGAVVGTLSKIIGPQGATATTHLITSLHDAVGKESVGDAVARARYSLINDKCPIGLLLVSHGELDTKAGS